ncbi:MAG TPA: VOC family protein [Jatrophihabitans sp.]|jgi:catechol 2,3-dioxygenase-like lactoylglutathione lyase family enzyme|nr:VOC family protein [Jatrophihabitans sp.]
MTDSILDHVSIQCVDLAASARFYDAFFAALGAARVMEFGSPVISGIGYGFDGKPEFWIGRHHTGEGFRETHYAFAARDRATVGAAFEAALAIGAEVLHKPRLWPEYHPNYYGAFVRDPDGNNVEAVCHLPE